VTPSTPHPGRIRTPIRGGGSNRGSLRSRTSVSPTDTPPLRGRFGEQLPVPLNQADIRARSGSPRARLIASTSPSRPRPRTNRFLTFELEDPGDEVSAGWFRSVPLCHCPCACA
jgi:hypothetical protein